MPLSRTFLRPVIALCLLGLLSPGVQARGGLDILLLLDNSGTQRRFDPQREVIGAVDAFVRALPADSRVGVLVYDAGARLVLPLTQADAGGAVFSEALRSAVTYRGAWTNTPEAVSRALEELASHGRADSPQALVLFTDGLIDTGDAAADRKAPDELRQQLAPRAAASNIALHSIAVTAGADRPLLQDLAETTGGTMVSAERSVELAAAFEDIARAVSATPSEDAEPAVATTPAVESPSQAVAEPATFPAPVPEPAPSPALAPESPAPSAYDQLPLAEPAGLVASPEESQPAAAVAPTPTPVAPGGPAAGTAPEPLQAPAGISLEELEKLPPGQAIVLRPGETLTVDEERPAWMSWAVGLGLLVLGGLGLFALLRRKSPPQPVVAAPAARPAVAPAPTPAPMRAPTPAPVTDAPSAVAGARSPAGTPGAVASTAGLADAPAELSLDEFIDNARTTPASRAPGAPEPESALEKTMAFLPEQGREKPRAAPPEEGLLEKTMAYLPDAALQGRRPLPQTPAGGSTVERAVSGAPPSPAPDVESPLEKTVMLPPGAGLARTEASARPPVPASGLSGEPPESPLDKTVMLNPDIARRPAAGTGKPAAGSSAAKPGADDFSLFDDDADPPSR